MRQFEVNEKYFAWLTDIVNPNNERGNFTKTFEKLHSTVFVYSIELDSNRFIDGVNLRDRFMYETHIPRAYIYQLDGPCSVLEMMVALALRCEEEIMTDVRFGNRTGKWFWSMMDGMDISAQDNYNYSSEYVETCIDIMMNRGYDYDGSKGGMFKVTNPRKDMRKTDIWYQLMWYLSENEMDNSDWLA